HRSHAPIPYPANVRDTDSRRSDEPTALMRTPAPHEIEGSKMTTVEHSIQENYGDLVGTDRVAGRLYTDPEIFRVEMEKIFYRTWVWVAHESEIPEAGSFKTTQVGDQP